MNISSILILGAGSAGLLAGLTLKRRLPQLDVRVVRSPGIGVIGVGEGTTPAFPRHLFEFLKLPPRELYEEVEPTWKLGVRFLWGPRPEFYYNFALEFEKRLPGLQRNNGFYHGPDVPWLSHATAFMAHGKAFPREANGMPRFHNNHAFHIENEKLVGWLEKKALAAGVGIIDATVTPETGGDGIAALVTESGERLTADFYIDASGFRSELLGQALGEPFVSYTDALFCDRAVVGGWTRTTEPILPYTTAETLDAGWSWQIEHEHHINRGYVFSSAFLSDDAARDEFLRRNPKLDPDKVRVVPFRSGRHRRLWVGNVLAIGNAAGFVEPLEATAIQIICVQVSTFADTLADALCEPPPTLVDLYNRYNGDQWDDIRNFLAVHHRFNTRLDTPFWRASRSDVALHGAEPIVDFYRENGPSLVAGIAMVHPTNSFGMDGYIAMLVGQDVPHAKPYRPTGEERTYLQQRRDQLTAEARNGMTVAEALQAIRGPRVQWASEGVRR